ncbi:ribosomal RNA small subunit methyltransferase A [Candidatus Parcubacteria bacterium]|nr:MAG: ribosomal RNA small subunit methyltransferase A [Candidatus Parcubacteria bacterium]
MGARLGQHFLRGTWAAAALTKEAGVSAKETCLEIGPGKGVLTRELLKTGAHVIAIEKDESLVSYLETVFEREIGGGQLKVIGDDVRNVDALTLGLKDRSFSLAANIPYYITGEILRRFLTGRAQPHTLALLVQKEVAERIVARDGKESILSISVKVYGTPRIAAKVSKGNFSPPPKVDSAILVVEHISRDFFKDVDEDKFFTTLKKGFSSKRKQLMGTVGSRALSKQVLAKIFHACDIPEKARAEDLSLDAWKRLTKQLDAIEKSRAL